MQSMKLLLLICLTSANFVAPKNEFHSLSLTSPIKDTSEKCEVNVPVIFYQTRFGQRLFGNSTKNIHYNSVKKCCEGFKEDNRNTNKCVPVCKNDCVNGVCNAPNECVCYDSFVKNEFDECIEKCPLGCPNGRCHLRGPCQCNKGYELDPSQSFCKAVCEKSCGTNQLCVSPNLCACKEGYLMKHGICQPVCAPDCGLGMCVAPNECKCFDYAIRKHGSCHSISDLVCENGIIESRIKCNCRVGYKYDKLLTTCIPDCGNECEYGTCIAPGSCRCFDNYEKVASTCVPKCEGGCGYYGKCISENVCGCGFIKQKCINGTCNSAGRCVCAEGLIRFLDTCVSYENLPYLVNTTSKVDRYSKEFQNEFYNHIGKFFLFL